MMLGRGRLLNSYQRSIIAGLGGLMSSRLIQRKFRIQSVLSRVQWPLKFKRLIISDSMKILTLNLEERAPEIETVL